tara:strand:- start:313 stop:1140 length:828 start_codon:yes stop_codon:yes gene_type:complete
MNLKKLGFKLIVVSMLFAPLNQQAEETSYYKGSIYIKEISKKHHETGFTFNNARVLSYEDDDKYYLVFGIPYDSYIGSNTYLLKNGNTNFPITFTIRHKEYATQYIKVDKIYTEPSKKLIDRVIREKNEITLVRNKWIDIKNDFNFILPVKGITTGVYGTRRFYNGKEGKYHNGLDIAAPLGTEIVAPSSGKVLLTGDYFYNGKFIYVEHGQNLKSIFIHLNKILVNAGDMIKKGQKIGEVGSTGKSTGPHLHWSVTLNSVYIDPETFINREIFQ